ncbi:NRPS [Trichoderma virens FT-333]|nr:NRPS [Trichoderma virens FT-333]
MSELASLRLKSDCAGEMIAPFSLLSATLDHTAVATILHTQYGLTNDTILEDAYPSTKLQEGLMAVSARQPGSYVAKQVYRLAEHVDIDAFKAAWERTIALCGNLRTRLIIARDLSVQVVIKNEEPQWEISNTTVQAYLAQKFNMGYGARLLRYAIVHEPSGESYFVLSIHHAIFDGWTLPMIMETLEAVYRGVEAPVLRPYVAFVKHILDTDEVVASNYWRDQLQDAKSASFPPFSSSQSAQPVTRVLEKPLNFTYSTQSGITKASILRAAWAIVLSRYSDSDDVTFGVNVSGRNAAVSGIESMPGLVVSTVPVRVRLNPEQTAAAFLEGIQTQSTDMIPYEQFGLQDISKLSPEAKDACDFSSLMVIQPMSSIVGHAKSILVSPEMDNNDIEERLQNYFSYPLVIQAHLYDDAVHLLLIYDVNVLAEAQLHALATQFDYVVQQLLSQDTEAKLKTITTAGPWDLQQAMSYNVKEPGMVTACVHELITQQSARDPHHEAIYSSEGIVTYANLDRLSNLLAHYLHRLGVRPESIVPFCFDKSPWAIVAMLAILKAGGAFLPLDPLHPRNRHEALVQEVGAEVMIVSPSSSVPCEGLTSIMVEFTIELLEQLSSRYDAFQEILPKAEPSNAAYVLFTSGSTGKPKGVLMEHSAFATSTLGHGGIYNLSPASRVFQFSNYIFDGSLGEIFTTLSFGGTVCVPSEDERLQKAPSFMREARVNTAMLTPSFVRTFTPEQVPSLRLLVLGGEPSSKDLLETWCGRLRLVNGYGPAEACNYATTHDFKPTDSPRTIGRGFNSACWIVDPTDYNKLTPIGCIGELIIQGNALARGYINDADRTANSFITNVDCLPKSIISGPHRFYLTGDLVRYTPDGQLEYLGRKDTQVKLRGQRLELGEIEYHVKKSLANIEHVAVDVAHRETGDTLIAFVSFKEKMTTTSGNILLLNDDLRVALATIMEHLKMSLPGYMVPSTILPVREMPFITSMKVDRKKLTAMAAALSLEEITSFSLVKRDYIAPSTPMEKNLANLWAQVLKISSEDIGKNDSFLQIGGDSISSIHLVSLAQQSGISLTVASIFADSKLSTMALSAGDGKIEPIHDVEPFSMAPTRDLDTLLEDVRAKCGLSSTAVVEDIYPVTRFQEGLMALAVKQPGSHIAKQVYRLSRNVDIARFKAAWKTTMELCSNLRTRIVLSDDASIQVVLKDVDHWEDTSNMTLKSYLETNQNSHMTYGSALSRHALIEQADGNDYFVWSIHHAVFDGWTTRLILNTLFSAYMGDEITPLNPYTRFINYTRSLDADAAKIYWSEQLLDAKRALFPTISNGVSRNKKSNTRVFEKAIELPRFKQTSITMASVLRATWSIVLAQHCDTNDVTFGTAISGRQAPVPGITEMAGPVVATVPVRVRLDKLAPVSEFLQSIQNQASEMIPFEQFGLQNIAKLNVEAKEACDFLSLLVIQPMKKLLDTGNRKPILEHMSATTEDSEDHMQNYFSYPLVIQGHVYEDSVNLVLIYDADILPEQQLLAVAHQFEHVAQQLVAEDSGTMPLGNVSVSGSWDIEYALRQNNEIPRLIESCFHTVVEQQTIIRPESPAVHGWDGNFTYGQLDQAANRLANHLVADYEIKNDELIHVCFEKSSWFVVAILAINKAGGAWIPLDPSHPAQRHQQIVDQTKARLALVSPSNISTCIDLVEHVVEVSPVTDEILSKTESSHRGPDREISPSNAAYVLFTSGSTAS